MKRAPAGRHGAGKPASRGGAANLQSTRRYDILGVCGGKTCWSGRRFLNRATRSVADDALPHGAREPAGPFRPRLLCRLAVFAIAIAAFGFSAASADPSAAPEAIVGSPKNVAGLQTLERQIKAVVAKALPAVVGMRIGASSGSGVIVSEDGIVMTAGHVVGKPGEAVIFFMADGKIAKGTTLGVFATGDAGLAKITDPGKWPFLEKGQSVSLQPGTWCLAIGHPLGYQKGRPPVVRVGRVLERGPEMIQTDCPLVAGDSGGPLLDLNGKIIGINSRIGGQTDMNLHVVVEVFETYWDRLVKGDSWRDAPPLREGPDVKTPFRPVVAAANQCVVRVKCEGRDAVLGTIVGPDGWILTKASELKGKIVCHLRDGRDLEARIVGLLAPLDLAMLKVDAIGLPVIPWATDQPGVGQWLATAGMSDEPLAVGIVSVPRRAVPPTGGMIGVTLSEKADEARIERVLPDSPAEKAGLKPNDVITDVNGEPVRSFMDVVDQLRHHRPGETIKIGVKRGEQTLEFAVKPTRLAIPALQQQQMMNSMGVGVSGRADDFSTVLQHDTVLRPGDCGGPVVQPERQGGGREHRPRRAYGNLLPARRRAHSDDVRLDVGQAFTNLVGSGEKGSRGESGR